MVHSQVTSKQNRWRWRLIRVNHNQSILFLQPQLGGLNYYHSTGAVGEVFSRHDVLWHRVLIVNGAKKTLHCLIENPEVRVA